jgi:uncharacterized membrane protein YbhN (UPF0104 family)
MKKFRSSKQRREWWIENILQAVTIGSHIAFIFTLWAITSWTYAVNPLWGVIVSIVIFVVAILYSISKKLEQTSKLEERIKALEIRAGITRY